MTVIPVNDNPVAVNDAATVAEDSGGTIVAVLGNDTDGPAPRDAVGDGLGQPNDGTAT